jgi:tetratricopeptide (TPR) repeat protein
MTAASAMASDWIRVQSPHFIIVGDASEAQMVQITAGLERFLPAVLTRVASAHAPSTESILIYLLKDAASYEPFRVQHDGIPADEPGYFIAGRDLNFITATEAGSDTRRVLYHELFHAIYRAPDSAPAATWASEGLADYFSTFDTGFGAAVPGHLQILRNSLWIPVQDLLTATHDSPYYKQPALRDKFYAESWLLVHYLLSTGAEGQSIDRLKSLKPADLDGLDASLRQYAAKLSQDVNRVRPAASVPEFPAAVTRSVLSDSEAAAYSGNLLLHLGRLEAAEQKLQSAVRAEHPSTEALLWLGALRLRENRNTEARELLTQAIQGEANNPMVHFYYSIALDAVAAAATENVRKGLLEDSFVHFEHSIELAPWIFDAYSWMAKLATALDSHYDRTEEILRVAVQAYPDRKELVEALSDVQNANTAHQEREAALREKNSREQLAAVLNSLRSPAPPAIAGATSAYAAARTIKPIVRHPTFEGNLSMIDCRKGITLIVRNAGRVVKFHTDTPLHLEFTSGVSNAANEAACGPVFPEHRVIVTYIRRKTAGSEGEPIRINYKD